MKNVKLALVFLVGMMGCKQAQPPAQVINSTGDGNTNTNWPPKSITQQADASSCGSNVVSTGGSVSIECPGHAIVNSDSTAPRDVVAARYVKDHDCKVDMVHRNYAEFDYETGEAKINPGYTHYHCKNPDVYVYVDFAGDRR